MENPGTGMWYWLVFSDGQGWNKDYRGVFWDKFPLCPTESMPASCKMDLTLNKAKPISNGGSTSGITYLIREKNPKPNNFHSGSKWREEQDFPRGRSNRDN